MTKKITQQLALATCSLLASSANAAEDWSVDGSYLSYVEANDRVSVSKTLANFERTLIDGKLSIGVVHDTMSGASPSGAIRSDDSLITFTSPSGSGGFTANGTGDDALIPFTDTRVQFGATREQQLTRVWQVSYGGVFSSENDYESFGTTVGIKREADNKLSSVNAGLAFTTDTIYRGDNNDTPGPLSNISSGEAFGRGKRNTYDALLGYTRVLNRTTIAQVNASVGLSEGYHTDPYKIISAADENDRIIANYYESRPDSRLRTALFGKVVHELANSDHSINLSYRLYQDDWGIQSHTLDTRYHHTLTDRQYLEPHLRFYHQSAADFYARKLDVDEALNPLLPDSGVVSADYRLDELTSVTAGIKYGFKISPDLDLRLRAEYLQQLYSESDFDTNEATIVQSSLRYTF
ncbi:MAG: DUF3570 domain-containing protein [Granulosicoccus sp.]|nr:DUF3570 domain-containing protein [Granulosicoccus sp.]